MAAEKFQVTVSWREFYQGPFTTAFSKGCKDGILRNLYLDFISFEQRAYGEYAKSQREENILSSFRQPFVEVGESKEHSKNSVVYISFKELIF